MPEVMTASETMTAETRCYCEPCKARRGEANTIAHSDIMSWSYKPARGWTKRRKTGGDSFPYCMGVELETSMRRDDGPSPLYMEQAADLRRPKTLWVSKHDSSVTGPEFASFPATLPFWHDKEPELSEMFRLLVHAGYRSHNGGRAGMHVNIGKEAFTGAQHIHRFTTFLYANQSWATLMAQRNDEQVSDWSPFRAITPYQATQMLTEWPESNKYTMVHAPDGQDRIEFRLPRGTLRTDRFYKNLEWTAAMIAYTRDEATTRESMKASLFTSWAWNYRDTYGNLLAFMQEKQSILQSQSRDDDRYMNTRQDDCKNGNDDSFEESEDRYDPDPDEDDITPCQCESCQVQNTGGLYGPTPDPITSTTPYAAAATTFVTRNNTGS